MLIDLHCHSFFSDGALSPELLIARAVQGGLQLLSITDHDTLEAYTVLAGQQLPESLSLVSGIEFSVRWKKYDIHVLAYQVKDTPSLAALIQAQKTRRIERAALIAEKLHGLGIPHALDKAVALAGHERIGRPHFAEVLIAAGKSKDMKSAFKNYLGKQAKAYVPTAWVSLQEAVAVIKASSGYAVMAHPLKYGLTRSKLHELMSEFKEAGGVGIEVVSGEMSGFEINEMADLSLRFELFASSGSDFHSDKASRIQLGRQATLPPRCLPLWKAWTL